MQYEMFFVPLRGGESEKDALNVFLRTRRVLKVDRQLQDGGWAFCVEWMPGPGAEGGQAAPGGGWSRPPKVDYREKLPPKQFEVFAKLRDARRRLAEAEGVQVYTVMTNEQLAEMVTRGVKTLAEMGRIDGVGEARLKKYGPALLEALSHAETEAQGAEKSHAESAAGSDPVSHAENAESSEPVSHAENAESAETFGGDASTARPDPQSSDPGAAAPMEELPF